MPLAEERAEDLWVRPAGCLERVNAPADTLVLGDDVPEPAARDLVDPGRERRCLGSLDRHLRRPCAAEGGQRPLELRPPSRIARMLEAVPNARVEDDHDQPGRQQHEPVLLGAAVEEERMTAPCQQRSSRVHQPNGHPDRTPLRLLGDARELDPGQLEPRRPAEREGDRHRERRRRRQPGAHRHGRGDRSLKPCGRAAPLAQELRDRGRIGPSP